MNVQEFRTASDKHAGPGNETKAVVLLPHSYRGLLGGGLLSHCHGPVVELWSWPSGRAVVMAQW